jgi:serine/threonine protein phosphatase PrpC
MLTPEEAESHPNANVITRAVGVADELKIEIVSGDARSGDQFLLATDGLTRVVEDSELAAELGSGRPRDVAEKLVGTVLARGAPDNVSLIITKLI